MELDDEVRTCVSLPGVPAGTIGTVTEIGRLFVVVRFGDGRQGYYAPQQLEPAVTPYAADECAPLGFGGEHVAYGSHLCMLPSSQDDLIETGAQFTAAGLEGGEECLCIVTDEQMSRLHEVMGGLRVGIDDSAASGRLAIVNPDDMYLGPSEFTAEKRLVRAGEVLSSISAEGGGKGRVFGCPPAYLFDLAEWWELERRVTSLLRRSGLMAVCGYQPGGWRTDQWARAEAVHPYVVKGGEVLPGGAAAG